MAGEGYGSKELSASWGRSPCLTLLPHQSRSLSLRKTIFVSIAQQDFGSEGNIINYPYVWLSPGPPSSDLAPFCGQWHSLGTILALPSVSSSPHQLPLLTHGRGLVLLPTFCPEELGSIEELWGGGGSSRVPLCAVSVKVSS